MDMKSLFNLNGKVAFVTGGATGIGRMATEAMVMAGASVFIASRKGSVCSAVAEEINKKGYIGKVDSFDGDLSTEEGVSLVANEIQKRTKGWPNFKK